MREARHARGNCAQVRRAQAIFAAAARSRSTKSELRRALGEPPIRCGMRREASSISGR
jgi:hypothetical protein